MKKISMIVLISLIVSACLPAMSEETPAASVEQAVVELLAGNLGLSADEISVTSNKEVEFDDACMEIVAFSDVTCAQAVTPGRIIRLEANDFEYEYHTSLDGDLIHPATLALTWTREGGIAGFCDRLVVFLSGEIYATNCKSQLAETAGTFSEFLSASEQSQFTAWFSKFGEANLDVSDPAGVSDRMTTTLVIYGNGNAKPNRADEQAFFEWAQSLYAKLSS